MSLNPSDERSFYVYFLIRPWNGIPCYVGKGRGERWTVHARAGVKHPNAHLARIFGKAQRLGQHVISVKVVENLTEDAAFVFEKTLIKQIGRACSGGTLANFTDGGQGMSGRPNKANLGRKFSDEHRRKISDALKGHAVSERSRAMASKVHSGKHLTLEHRAALSLANIGHKRSLGFKHTLESREKMSVAKRGKPKSDQHRAKIAAAHIARHRALGATGQAVQSLAI